MAVPPDVGGAGAESGLFPVREGARGCAAGRPLFWQKVLKNNLTNGDGIGIMVDVSY